jgi:DNA-binding transcriptional MerR regulator
MQPIFKNITRVSKELGIPQYTLRYWEKVFDMPAVQKINTKRYYREKDVARLRQIKYLLKDECYSHRGVKKFLQRQQAILQNVSKKSQDEPNRSFKVDL